MSPSGPVRSLALLRRFGGARDGVVAVEFALLALPFMLLLFAVLELALIFLLSASLDTAMERTARSIRTGGFQKTAAYQTMDAATKLATQKSDFKASVCSRMAWLSNSCDTNLTIDVRTQTQWIDTNVADPIEEVIDPKTGEKKKQLGSTLFNTGGPQDIVLVRGFYKWPLLCPFLSQGLDRLGDGMALITSTQTFRNEPYPT